MQCILERVNALSESVCIWKILGTGRGTLSGMRRRLRDVKKERMNDHDRSSRKIFQQIISGRRI